MDMFYYMALIVLLPFVTVPLIPLVYRAVKDKVGWFAACVAAACFFLIANTVPAISQGQTFSGNMSWIPGLSVNFGFYADGLAVLLGLIVSFIGILIIAYSTKYLSKDEDLVRYYQYLLIFMGAMLGVAFSDTLIQLFIFWELTSISSFLLIGYYRKTKESIYGATKALIITAGVGLFMFVGFMFLYVITGTYGISEILTNPAMVDTIKNSPLFTITLILILLGAMAKSAQGPFYIWLPNAMEAPTPVSAFLHSATMVKAGVFLVARFHPVFSGTIDWFILVSGTGILTMVIAGFFALRHTDLKSILAYSTISQLGYLMTMYGYTTFAEPSVGVAAATFHLFNHAAFKACLFLLVGIIAHELHTRDIRKMGGLRKEMPITFILMVIAAASMAGIPPLNGYLSKELFYEASVHMAEALGGGFAYFIPILAIAGGAFTFAYSFRLIIKIFMGQRTQDPDVPRHVHDPSIVMLAPPALLAIIIIAVGIFPAPFIDSIVQPAINAIAPESEHLHVALWHGLTPAFLMTIITFVLGFYVYTKYDTLAASQMDFKQKYPRISLNSLYNRQVDNAFKLGLNFGKVVQTGQIRNYMKAMLIFTICLVLIPFMFAITTDIPVFADNVIFHGEISKLLLLILILVAALGAVMLPRYIYSISIASACGLFVSLLYAYLKAPDLAMTQLCVETLSTILFLVVLLKLRTKEAIRPEKPADNLNNALIAAGCGFVLFIMLAGADLAAPFESFSHYFIANAVEFTGGKNIVNVIVVDFRGYDTFGEIAVLSIAALAVYNLIKSRMLESPVKKESIKIDSPPANRPADSLENEIKIEIKRKEEKA